MKYVDIAFKSHENPCGSAGEASACNVRDLGLIPGLGRSPGEGKGCPLQYTGLENSMGCIVHGVTMQETQVGSPSPEDPLEKEMSTHSSTLAWKMPGTEEPCRLQSLGSQRVGHD